MNSVQKLPLLYEEKIKKYFPELYRPLKAALAVVAINSFKNNQQPVALIFSGPSGSGKTTVLSFLMPPPESKLPFYRADNFTPRSFVSHAANIQKSQLEEIDLLPKIERKTLITKELAPLFRGKTDELAQLFSILISVLDGKGLVTASGAQGTRGYDRQINFTWLGATTPLSNEIFKLMAQLGTRLLFYDMTRREKTVDELLDFAKQKNPAQHEQECKQAVEAFLAKFFSQHPAGSFDESTIHFPEHLLRRLCGFAKLLACLRTPSHPDIISDTMPQKESEERAIIIMKNIALGSALINGRDYVNGFDLSLIQHIALSSCPEGRRKIMRKLLESRESSATTADLISKTGMSKPTVIKYMRELHTVGVCTLDDTTTNENCFQITLASEYQELINNPQVNKKHKAYDHRNHNRSSWGVKRKGGVLNQKWCHKKRAVN